MRDFCGLSFGAFQEEFESMYVSVRCALRMTMATGMATVDVMLA